MQLSRRSAAKDIALPAERKPDPRLPKPFNPEATGRAIRKGWDTLKAKGLVGKRSPSKGGR